MFARPTTLRPADVAIRVAIVGLALATGYIHSTLGGLLFTLNAVGYVVAAIAMVIPLALAVRFRWAIRLGLMGYAATTIIGWALQGPYYSTAYLAKDLVSDQAGVAPVRDTTLVNAWGISLSQTGGAFWVSANGTGISEVYTGDVTQANGSRTAIGQPFKVSIPGGVANGVRHVFSGSPALAAGEERVLFLWAGQSGEPQVIGLSQGLMRLERLPDGTVMAVRTPVRDRMLDAEGRPVWDEGVEMPLADLRKMVRRKAEQ